ncbi:hypothetical protein M422DRAFT_67008, partial [Sphaerobolus stellatus SS14]
MAAYSPSKRKRQDTASRGPAKEPRTANSIINIDDSDSDDIVYVASRYKVGEQRVVTRAAAVVRPSDIVQIIEVLDSDEEQALDIPVVPKKRKPTESSEVSTIRTPTPNNLGPTRSNASASRRAEPPKKKTKPNRSVGSLGNPIEIEDSDEDVEIVEVNPNPIEEEEEGEEEEEDYDNIHAGFFIDWGRDDDIEEAREPIGSGTQSIEEELGKLALDEYVPITLRPKERKGKIQFKYKLSYLLPTLMPRTVDSVVKHYSTGFRSRTGLLRHRVSRIDSHLRDLRKVKYDIPITLADNISTISQSGDRILASSITPGGDPSEPDNVQSNIRHNKSNTLFLWSKEDGRQWVDEHHSILRENGEERTNYWSVDCARLDPQNPGIMVSTGFDGKIVIRHSSNGGTNKTGWLCRDKSTCHDIQFAPNTGDRSVFAAPSTDGNVYLYSYSSSGDNFGPFHTGQFSDLENGAVLSNRWSGAQASGAITWGRGPTERRLFVCNENRPGHERPMHHGIYDAYTATWLYDFDEKGDGEELCLNPSGSQLALLTNNGGFRINLYDVRTQKRAAFSEVVLPEHLEDRLWTEMEVEVEVMKEVEEVVMMNGVKKKVKVMKKVKEKKMEPQQIPPEVCSAKWSPDELLLAVGLNDDTAYIYDVRQLTRPVLSILNEVDRSKTSTILEWSTRTSLRTPRLGLITGGTDGCVSIWDIATACAERTILARVDNPVAAYHFGDVTKGEKPLIVGDTAG